VTRPTYAGIGSRKTPRTLATRMRTIASVLESRGWMLHSGGADHADTWFEEGVRDPANARIFLPWRNFRNHKSSLYPVRTDERAHEIARQYHPAYHRLSIEGRLLMARNSYQVLGPDLASPVTCIVCWTPDGEASGGTGQALRIAAANDVPVFNLHDATALERLDVFVRDACRSPMMDSSSARAVTSCAGSAACRTTSIRTPNLPTMHRICDGAWPRDEQPDVVWVKT
jgi:hypothetical protein